jgi:two-component sensor histidine kinase
MRLALVAATVAVALLLTRSIRREIAAREDAAARAELERALAREASHRVKNDLQTAADLLLLAKPESGEGAVFDETAARLLSIATVHRMLMDGGPIDGGVLLRRIVQNAPVPVDVEAEPGSFDAETAKKLGIVANELVMNASRHGAPPIVVRLRAGELTRLAVDDGGGEVERPPGFGLDLVGLMVERGLGGRFELRRRRGGGTRAEVVFPVAQA